MLAFDVADEIIVFFHALNSGISQEVTKLSIFEEIIEMFFFELFDGLFHFGVLFDKSDINFPMFFLFFDNSVKFRLKV